MDITPYLTLQPAPRAVFARLPTHADRPRFYLPSPAGWRPVTWGAFASMIRSAALWLSAEGLEPGERAVVFGGNSVAWGAAALAIQAAGGVMVPLYPASTVEQAAYVLAHSDARAVFVDGAAQLSRVLECLPRCPDVQRVVLLDEELDLDAALAGVSAEARGAIDLAWLRASVVPWSRLMERGGAIHARFADRFDSLLDAIDLDSPSLMLYTSGTTGNPKGVPLTHRNVGVNGRDWLECLGSLIDEDSVDALWLPFSHIFGFGELCLGNTLGFTSYLVDPGSVLARLPEIKPSVFMSVPAYWEKIAQAVESEVDPAKRRARLDAVTGGRLKFCLSGGAGLKLEVKELLHQCGLLIIEGYGLTETSPTLTMNRPEGFRFDTVGRAFPSVELKLAEDGEILARGPNVFGGYHKDPDASRAAFTDDGWFLTGDVGRFTDDGYLQIVDRKKDILVTAGGKNVPPANIEVRFRDDPLFAHVVVYGDGRRYLVAGIWLDPAQAAAARSRGEDVNVLVTARVDAVNAELASYETIKRYFVSEIPLTVDEGLLTASLKVRRKAVYQRFAKEFESLYEPGG